MVSVNAETPLASLVVEAGTTSERIVPIFDRLVVGRECTGVDESRRVVIDDEQVSRHHFEIRLDIEHDRAAVVDLSTNGTRVNGVRVERGVAVPIRAGDRLSAGRFEMVFSSSRFVNARRTDPRRTFHNVELQDLVLVVGDIVNYSALSQVTPSEIIYEGLERLYRPLRVLLDEHRGTFVHYQGDAFFAFWEHDADGTAAASAVGFACAAVDTVTALATRLPFRTLNGEPIRMGWAVVSGEGVVSSLTGTPMTVLGDTTNVAFRLAGMAARDGRPEIVVTTPVRNAIGDQCVIADPESVSVKGRTGRETLYGVTPR